MAENRQALPTAARTRFPKLKGIPDQRSQKASRASISCDLVPLGPGVSCRANTKPAYKDRDSAI